MRKKVGLTTVSILSWSLGLMGCGGGGGESLPSVPSSSPPAADTAVQKSDPVAKGLKKGAGPVGGARANLGR